MLELKANVISGDANSDAGRLCTFNALFHKGTSFSEIGQVGSYNLLNMHPIVGVELGQGWFLRAQSSSTGARAWRAGCTATRAT